MSLSMIYKGIGILFGFYFLFFGIVSGSDQP